MAWWRAEDILTSYSRSCDTLGLEEGGEGQPGYSCITSCCILGDASLENPKGVGGGSCD